MTYVLAYLAFLVGLLLGGCLRAWKTREWERTADEYGERLAKTMKEQNRLNAEIMRLRRANEDLALALVVMSDGAQEGAEAEDLEKLRRDIWGC